MNLIKGLIFDWLQHGLVVLGALLVSDGLLKQQDEASFVGAIMTLIGLLWSAGDEIITARLKNSSNASIGKVQS